ncbi:hypothetical protein AWM70_18620 [Paenibacillus yonginensis]|uniref:Uncharacterized protein n=1 Tax=Paenibacillus yonginensis TaxID=1462996 RepID=A0A1B1N4G6_9BACL|nr:hypothetical protein [Paenibacillus yonginensis]ANS76338.1 hypothetical protein AWM70_18620 [Paenibacillus yonginensis]
MGSHFLIEAKTEWQKEWITTYYCDLFFDSLDKAMGAESTYEIHVLDQASLINENLERLHHRMSVIEEKNYIILEILQNLTRKNMERQVN